MQLTASGTDSGTLLVKDDRQRNANECDEPGHSCCPVDSEVLVHVSDEERESGTEEGSEDRICCKDGCGVDCAKLPVSSRTRWQSV